MWQSTLARVSNKLPLFARCIVLEAFSLPALGVGYWAQHVGAHPGFPDRGRRTLPGQRGRIDNSTGAQENSGEPKTQCCVVRCPCVCLWLSVFVCVPALSQAGREESSVNPGPCCEAGRCLDRKSSVDSGPCCESGRCLDRKSSVNPGPCCEPGRCLDRKPSVNPGPCCVAGRCLDRKPSENPGPCCESGRCLDRRKLSASLADVCLSVFVCVPALSLVSFLLFSGVSVNR